MKSIKQKSSGSERNLKEAINRILRVAELLLGIFFVIVGGMLFLFVDDETVYGVVLSVIGIGFLLHFYTTRERRGLKPINSKQTKKGGGVVIHESRKEKKGRF